MNTHKVLLRVATFGLAASLLASCAGLGASQPQAIQASGLIEATEVAVSPETSGKVAEVLVKEGDAVKSGDVLLRLDDQGLQTQRASVEAAGNASEAAAQAALDTAHKALSDLRQNAPVVTAQAALDLANARKALDDAQKHRTWQQKGNRASQDTIDATESRLTLAKDAVDKANAALNRVKDKAPTDPVRAQAEANLQDAKDQRDAIVRILNWYKGSPTDIDQSILDAQVLVAQANATNAELEYQKVKDGPNPNDLAIAQDQVATAQANLAAAKAQTAAQLKAIDLQLEKLEVRAPEDGVVLTRSVEAGEVAQAGMTAITLGKLNDLKVTVYIAEDRYGQLSLGDHASLSVDSFPGQTFDAVVTRISNQAEYTPRNVQTKEVRQTTVYGVELSVQTGKDKLIPGMPTDVVFKTTSG
jgi:HlyD family secretion protein